MNHLWAGLVYFADIANLLNALEKLEPKLTERQTDIQYLKDFVSSNDFRTLLKVHSIKTMIIISYLHWHS